MAESGKVALITNCTEYAGPASVLALADEGFILHCQDARFADPAIRAGFEADHPAAILTETNDPEELVAEVVGRHGRLDSVVSNDCGYNAQFGLDVEDLRHALEVLTVMPYRLCAAALPVMRQQGGGSIVLITSGAPLTNPVIATDGEVPTHYVVGREAAHSLVRCFAQDFAKYNIQVNAIAPYMLYSQTFFPSEQGPADPKYKQYVADRVPMARFGLDDEFGLLVSAFASGRGKFISGQVVAFSGAGA